MLRKIVDYKNISNEILEKLVALYPYGYSDDDIITFRNAKNEVIEAVRVDTPEIVYLVKVGNRLVKVMEDFNEDNDDVEDNEETNNEELDVDNLEDKEEDF